MDAETHIVLATPADCDALIDLVARIAAETHSEAADTASRAPEAVARSLVHSNVLTSRSIRCLLAITDQQAVGWALLVRVPKLDDRLGFLYLDELHVLKRWRRRGVGRALLERSAVLSRELGLAGIRLLARMENRPARALYESFGFKHDESLLYQFVLDRENAES